MLAFWEKLGREFQESLKKLLRDYTEALVLAILLALIVRWIAFGSYRVGQNSMLPNIFSGDFIVGYKLPFGVRLPFTDSHWGKMRVNRFDLLIYECDEGLCIERAIGLPGDRIEFRTGKLIINGEEAEYRQGTAGNVIESWGGHEHQVMIPSENPIQLGPQIVLPERVLLANDRRLKHSDESPAFQLVPISTIEARAVSVWLSWDSESDRIRWERVGNRLY